MEEKKTIGCTDIMINVEKWILSSSSYTCKQTYIGTYENDSIWCLRTQGYTFLSDNISPCINLGGVQLIPTATTLLQDSATEPHSSKESPLTTWIPSLELNENQAGIFMFSSSRSSA